MHARWLILTIVVMALVGATLACNAPRLTPLAPSATPIMRVTPAASQATAEPAASPTPDGSPASSTGGAISGDLSFPGSALPPMRVVAFDAKTMKAVKIVQTAPGQNSYRSNLPRGEYYVVAYTLDGKLAGGYTKAVPCGLEASCTDHTLIPVTVTNRAVEPINPGDWYAPPGVFPPAP